MSNKITFEQPACKEPTFGDLSAGELFRLPGSSSNENVYMRAYSSGYETNAVLLRTGSVYNMSGDRRIIPVTGPVTITPNVG